MMRFILLLLLLHTRLYAQTAWEVAGKAPEKCVIHHLYADTINNKLYGIGYFRESISDIPGLMGPIRIMVLESGVWETVTEKSVLGMANAMCMYKNEFYIAGVFLDKQYDTGVLRWNGNDWEPLEILHQRARHTSIPHPNVLSLAVFNDKLFIAGGFASKNKQYYNLASWDGTDLDFFNQTQDEIVTSLKVTGKSLYAGSFNKSTGKLLKFDNDRWVQIGSEVRVMGAVNGKTLDGIEDIIKYNGDIYICGNFPKGQNILKLENDSVWGPAFPIEKEHSIGGFSCQYVLEESKGFLITAGHFSWGSKPDKGKTIGIWNGTNWVQYTPEMAIGNNHCYGYGGRDIYSVAILDNTVYFTGRYTLSFTDKNKSWKKHIPYSVLKFDLEGDK